jgi:hypothetical protein
MKKEKQRKHSKRRWRAGVVYAMGEAVLVGTRLLLILVVAALCDVSVRLFKVMVSGERVNVRQCRQPSPPRNAACRPWPWHHTAPSACR